MNNSHNPGCIWAFPASQSCQVRIVECASSAAAVCVRPADLRASRIVSGAGELATDTVYANHADGMSGTLGDARERLQDHIEIKVVVIGVFPGLPGKADNAVNHPLMRFCDATSQRKRPLPLSGGAQGLHTLYLRNDMAHQMGIQAIKRFPRLPPALGCFWPGAFGKAVEMPAYVYETLAKLGSGAIRIIRGSGANGDLKIGGVGSDGFHFLTPGQSVPFARMARCSP